MPKDITKIAILIGSSNGNGNTVSLVNAVVQTINADVFNLKDYQISPFDYVYSFTTLLVNNCHTHCGA